MEGALRHLREACVLRQFRLADTRHCGNKTIHLLASLIYDIIRRQHEHVTERTITDAGVDKLRQESIRSREQAVQLMRGGNVTAVERFWREHLQHMRDLVLAAYEGPVTIDVLSEPARKPRAVGKVRRPVPPVQAGRA